MSIDLVRRPGEAYDKSFGDDKLCACGHTYYRHFDWSEDYFPTCKYCSCMEWEEPQGLVPRIKRSLRVAARNPSAELGGPPYEEVDKVIEEIAKVRRVLTSSGTASLPGSGYMGKDREYVLVDKEMWDIAMKSLDKLLNAPEPEELEHVCERDDPLDECPDCGLDAQ
jgi:hypothetical protein